MLVPDFLCGIKDISQILFYANRQEALTRQKKIATVGFKERFSAMGMKNKLISKQLIADKNYTKTETKAVLVLVESVKNKIIKIEINI